MQATELSENEIVYLCRAHHVGLGSKSGRHQTRRVNMSDQSSGSNATAGSHATTVPSVVTISHAHMPPQLPVRK